MESAISIVLPADTEMIMSENIDPDHVRANVRSSLTRNLPELIQLPQTDATLCIVGGGPSAAEEFGQIKGRYEQGQHIWALNGAHDWLISRGIIPRGAWCVDSRPDNAKFFRKPHRLCHYFIASRCDPLVFDALKEHNVTIWHDASTQTGTPDAPVIVGGGTTIGLKTMVGAYLCGYRELHLFGYDSSYRDGEHHAYPMPQNDGEPVVEVNTDGRRFITAPWMLYQVKRFGLTGPELQKLGVDIHVHGDGLLQWVALSGHRAEEAA